jgi:hypothetical protein
VQERPELLVGRCVQRCDSLVSFQAVGVDALQKFDEQLLLVADVPVQRWDGDAGGLGDVAHGNAVKTAGLEQFRRNQLDLTFSPVGLDARLHRGSVDV